VSGGESGSFKKRPLGSVRLGGREGRNVRVSVNTLIVEKHDLGNAAWLERDAEKSYGWAL
jgi:hypothetical protein